MTVPAPTDAAALAAKARRRVDHANNIDLSTWLPKDVQDLLTDLAATVESLLTRAADAEQRLTNRESVLGAYKAHHATFHPDCNISGPPNPPRPQHRPFA